MIVLVTLLLANSPPHRVRRSLRTLLYGAMIFTTVSTIVFWICAVIECRPMWSIYDERGIRDGQCLPPNVIRRMANGHAVVNAAADLFLALLSIFVVYGVQRSMREKVALGVVLALAFGLVQPSYGSRSERSVTNLLIALRVLLVYTYCVSLAMAKPATPSVRKPLQPKFHRESTL